MKRAVGIILYIPHKGRVAALLRKRGSLRISESGLIEDESWPGGTQPTAHGGCKPEENYLQALVRELHEELGSPMSAFIETSADSLKELWKKTDLGKKEVVTYGLFVEEPRFVADLQLPFETGEFTLVYADTKIVDLASFDKKEGVVDRRVVALFEDNMVALAKGFELYGKW